MKTTRTPEDNCCTKCGKRVDAATDPDQFSRNVPSEGDVSICLYCGNIMVYGKRRMLRSATAAEMVLFLSDDRILRLLKAREETERATHGFKD